jgi:phospho-N-acetylmuramoyl-pentapeptide-transferase
MGGLIIVVGVTAVLIWHAFLPYRGFGETPRSSSSPEWAWAALVVFIGFALIGFIDDFVIPRMMPGKRGLGWKQKLLMQIALGLIAAWLLTGEVVSVGSALTLFTVLFFANAYNFADGLDALAGTLLISLAIGLAAIGDARFYNTLQAPAMMALVGAVIPFLFLNAPPAKLFMGDVGSLPIGALLGLAVSWIAFVPPPETAPVAVQPALILLALLILSLVMVAELLPPPMQIFWVKVFKKRLFPYTPIHHAFEKAGWKETRVVAMFALVQFVLMMIAITLTFAGMSTYAR